MIQDKIKRLLNLYNLSKTEGFTLLDWQEAVELLQEIIKEKKRTLDKWLK